jgi:hypothetical protein
MVAMIPLPLFGVPLLYFLYAFRTTLQRVPTASLPALAAILALAHASWHATLMCERAVVVAAVEASTQSATWFSARHAYLAGLANPSKRTDSVNLASNTSGNPSHTSKLKSTIPAAKPIGHIARPTPSVRMFPTKPLGAPLARKRPRFIGFIIVCTLYPAEQTLCSASRYKGHATVLACLGRNRLV